MAVRCGAAKVLGVRFTEMPSKKKEDADGYLI